MYETEEPCDIEGYEMNELLRILRLIGLVSVTDELCFELTGSIVDICDLLLS